VLSLHPQAAQVPPPRAEAGAWFDFEEGAQGWAYGPLPFSGHPQTASYASEGKLSLKLDFPLAGLPDGTRAIGVMREIDASLFNLDRLEFDAALEGGGTAQLYCWITDNYHHWYQQRLDAIDGNRRWNTVGVDFSDHGDWQAVGGAPPWSAECRRRIRRLGIAAFRHAAPAAQAATGSRRPRPPRRRPAGCGGPAALYLDRFRRFGWAVEKCAQAQHPRSHRSAGAGCPAGSRSRPTSPSASRPRTPTIPTAPMCSAR
jgi:hypothetical protein